MRGFQVAPAELEGHLLDHPDVSEACVVGILDDYSGELPLAFVQLKPAAAARIAKNPQEAEAIKASISKVCPSPPPPCIGVLTIFLFRSTSPIRKCTTSDWQVA